MKTLERIMISGNERVSLQRQGATIWYKPFFRLSLELYDSKRRSWYEVDGYTFGNMKNAYEALWKQLRVME